MKKAGAYLAYLVFKVIVKLFYILPWSLLYWLSDGLRVFLFSLVRYRTKVVRGNLERLFPDKPTEWKNNTLKAFYGNLSDIIVESIKGYGMPSHELLKRFNLENVEELSRIEALYPRIIIASAHCGNWEWGAITAPLLLNYSTYGLYKPLSNPFIDRWMRQRRAKEGMHLVPISATSSMFKNQSEKAAYFFITDQHPSRRQNAIWVRFFDYPTAWIHGLEKYAHLHRLPVFYFGIRRQGRGQYKVYIREIALHPEELPWGEITRRYVKVLEEAIKEDPANWLWTHRRWKYAPVDSDQIWN
ncbi:MAG: lysophospholipid acyltransferase family protein [Bacteroidales bacterium]